MISKSKGETTGISPSRSGANSSFVRCAISAKKDAPARNQDRLNKTKKVYEEIMKWYLTDEAKEKLAEFNENIPNAEISDTKKIDFVLWQTK